MPAWSAWAFASGVGSTSGTGGPPKPVMHTWTSLAGAVRSDPSLHGRRWLLTYNPSGFAALQVMLQSLLTGGCLSVPGSREPALVSRAMLDQKQLRMLADQVARAKVKGRKK